MTNQIYLDLCGGWPEHFIHLKGFWWAFWEYRKKSIIIDIKCYSTLSVWTCAILNDHVYYENYYYLFIRENIPWKTNKNFISNEPWNETYDITYSKPGTSWEHFTIWSWFQDSYSKRLWSRKFWVQNFPISRPMSLKSGATIPKIWVSARKERLPCFLLIRVYILATLFLALSYSG